MNAIALHPAKENELFLAGWSREVEAERNPNVENCLHAAKAIGADILRREHTIKDVTHRASDLLDAVLADGRVDPAELAVLRKARKLTHQAEELADTESTSVCANPTVA